MPELQSAKALTRQDLIAISRLIPPGSKVLDLGCGDGFLLKYLKDNKQVTGLGVEISEREILESMANGVEVVKLDLDDGLGLFSDNSFDCVVLSQTMQTVQRPDFILEEMVRVGKQGVISFINFGYYKARMQFIFSGRMPETKTIPNPWFNTPNIHLSTILDFRSLCGDKSISIDKEIPLLQSRNPLSKIFPNWFAATSVFLVSRK